MADSKRPSPFNEPLIERLLAGPDDVELSPRDLARLEAHLRQPVSFATIQKEKKATGHSPTEAARNKLKRIRDFNRGLQGQGFAEDVEKPDTPAPAGVKAKQSTVRGEARAKLIAALTKHHQYADGSCLNQEPIGCNALARAARVSHSTASAFFQNQFGGYAKYRAACRNFRTLIAALKVLNDEFTPRYLLGLADSYLATPKEDDTDE